jgi:hypothetical protein
MASSTSVRACLASRASSSAACARNSTAVSLSSAATIREWASFKAMAASCSLQSASLIISSRARSAPLGAGFGLSGVIFYAAEDFGRLVHEIESCRAAVWCRRPTKAQDIFALTACRSEAVLCHVVQRL